MEHTPKVMAAKLLVLGIIIILVRMYTAWDIWIVLGALLIIKAVLHFAMPSTCCTIEKAKAKKK